jgi:predicted CoA-binding protein
MGFVGPSLRRRRGTRRRRELGTRNAERGEEEHGRFGLCRPIRFGVEPVDPIGAFLLGSVFAVAGASNDRAKYGNMVLRCYLQHGLTAYPVNPNESKIEGVDAYPTLSALPTRPHGVSIITPPRVTEKIVDDAIAAGFKHLWMQPGAESRGAIERAEAAGVSVVHSGPCILVVLGFRP